jgi:hypothetical protein
MRSTNYFAVIPAWILEHPDLHDAAVRLYGVLRRYADQSGAASPSVPTLAKRVHKSDRQIRRLLKDLEDVGALQVVAAWGEGGKRLSNRYILVTAPPEITSERILNTAHLEGTGERILNAARGQLEHEVAINVTEVSRVKCRGTCYWREWTQGKDPCCLDAHTRRLYSLTSDVLGVAHDSQYRDLLHQALDEWGLKHVADMKKRRELEKFIGETKAWIRGQMYPEEREDE